MIFGESKAMRHVARKLMYACSLPEDSPKVQALPSHMQIAARVLRDVSGKVCSVSGNPIVGGGTEGIVFGNPATREVVKVYWHSRNLEEDRDRLRRHYSILESELGDIAVRTGTDIKEWLGRDWLTQTQPWLTDVCDFRDYRPTKQIEDQGIIEELRVVAGARDTILHDHGLDIDLFGRRNLVIGQGVVTLLDVSLSNPLSPNYRVSAHEGAALDLKVMAGLVSSAPVLAV